MEISHMKKTLLAAALMVGFAGVAQAETSVTLYGVVDGGIGYERLKGSIGSAHVTSEGELVEGGFYAREGRDYSVRNTRTGLLSGVQRGNRWGLRGSEDLGNGLRMIFQLESGFDIADGHSAQGGRLFGREAHFGLAGDSWGQLTFGRQTTVSSQYIPGIGSPFGASFMQANFGATFSAVNTTRYDNMIQYQTPSFAGFQAGLGYSFNTNGAQLGTLKAADGTKYKPDQKAWTAAVRYANGPIAVGLSYDQNRSPRNSWDDGNGTWGPSSKRVTSKEWILAGSYDFEVVKLHLAGGQVRNGLITPQGYLGDKGAGIINAAPVGVGKGFRANNYTVGLSAPVGAGKIMASWAMSDVRKAADNYSKSDMKDQQIYSLGYTYPLSKRTNVYAIGSYAKNVHYQPKAKATLVGVGLSHQF